MNVNETRDPARVSGFPLEIGIAGLGEVWILIIKCHHSPAMTTRDKDWPLARNDKSM